MSHRSKTPSLSRGCRHRLLKVKERDYLHLPHLVGRAREKGWDLVRVMGLEREGGWEREMGWG